MRPARIDHWPTLMMSSAGNPSRFAWRCPSHNATTIESAMRMPYQRMTSGPTWKAIAPGECMTLEDITQTRKLVLCSRSMPGPRIVFLGTGGALNPERYQPTILVDAGATRLLLDTGGGLGVVRRLLEAKIDPSSINHIFLSHRHLARVAAFEPLLLTMSYRAFRADRPLAPVALYALAGSAQAIRATHAAADASAERRFRDRVSPGHPT